MKADVMDESLKRRMRIAICPRCWPLKEEDVRALVWQTLMRVGEDPHRATCLSLDVARCIESEGMGEGLLIASGLFGRATLAHRLVTLVLLSQASRRQRTSGAATELVRLLSLSAARTILSPRQVRQYRKAWQRRCRRLKEADDFMFGPAHQLAKVASLSEYRAAIQGLIAHVRADLLSTRASSPR